MKPLNRKYKSKMLVTALDLIPLCDHFCAVCLSKSDLSGHHIRSVSSGGTDDLDNLMCLCRKHHNIVELESNNLIMCIYSKILRIRGLERDVERLRYDAKITKFYGGKK